MVLAGVAATPLLYLRSPAATSLPALTPTTPSARLQMHAHRPLPADTAYSTAENRAAAGAEAARIFESVRLPPAASTASQVGTSFVLAEPCLSPSVQTRAIDSGWWVDPEPASMVRDWVVAHPPPGLAQQGVSVETLQGAELLCVEFTGESTDAYQQPFLTIAITASGADSSELRVDAQVGWRPGKSPLEVVPPRSSAATMVAAYELGPGRVATVGAANLSATEAQGLLSDIDSLVAMVPGETLSCAADSGYRVLITVTAAGGARETFTYWPACQTVLASAAGKALPPLQSAEVIDEDVQEWVGTSGGFGAAS
jgi:hypothetical protein